MADGDASRAKKGKHVAKKKHQSSDDRVDDIPDFNSTHFETSSMANRFYDGFMPRMVLTSYFVNIDCIDSLCILNKKLRELLDSVGWANALNV